MTREAKPRNRQASPMAVCHRGCFWEKEVCTMKKTICIILAAVLLMSSAVGAFAEGERVLTPADEWTVITLDPGHGATSGGGYKYNGKWYNEAELVLKIAKYLKAELETYYRVRVILTRETDSQEEYDRIYNTTDRFDIAERHCSDIFVSLHINGGVGNSSTKGACVIVPKADGTYKPELVKKDYELARCILGRLNEAGVSTYGTGYLTRNTEAHPPERYPDGSLADYYSNTQLGLMRNMVAVLVEHCFIDSYSDASRFLFTDDGLKTLAHADCLGIADYLGLRKATADELAMNEYCLTDYRRSWAKDYIDYAIANGLAKGFPDDTFRPNEETSRGEFVTFLGRAAGVTGTCSEDPFPDVPSGSYCAVYVDWARANGIVDGSNDGLFHPNDKVSREQMAKIMTCYLGYLGIDVSSEKTLEDFPIGDVESVSPWAAEYVVFCYENGLLNGTDEGFFEPLRCANRAEVCTVLVRLAEYINGI